MISEQIMEQLRPVTQEERNVLAGSETIDYNLYMNERRQVIHAEKLLSEGKLITVRPHTRFIAFPEHSHDYIEAVYMCEGETTHTINGHQITLHQGDFLLMNQHAKQSIEQCGEGDIAVNFIILPQFFDQTLEMMGSEDTPIKKFIVDSLTEETAEAGYLLFRVGDVLPVQNLIENLLWTLINDTPNKRHMNQFTMGLLFLTLMNYTDRLTSDVKEDEVLIQVFKYIEEHYRDGSLTEAADLLHVDFYWLSREIKNRTGKNYTDLLQEKRLAQASFLLKNTNMNVADIAISIGYDNVSYFHRIFAKKFGQSPKKYRDASRVVG